jgi:hypothetical protein
MGNSAIIWGDTLRSPHGRPDGAYRAKDRHSEAGQGGNTGITAHQMPPSTRGPTHPARCFSLTPEPSRSTPRLRHGQTSPQTQDLSPQPAGRCLSARMVCRRIDHWSGQEGLVGRVSGLARAALPGLSGEAGCAPPCRTETAVRGPSSARHRWRPAASPVHARDERSKTGSGCWPVIRMATNALALIATKASQRNGMTA